jgi:hypothetical protein
LVLIKRYFIFYEMVITEEEYDIPDVDVSDIFDDNDEADHHKKPRAKDYPSETIYGHNAEDQHKKCRTEEHTLDILDGDDNNNQNKKPKAQEYGKG